MDAKKIVNNPVIRKILLFSFKGLSAVNQILPKNKTRVLFYDSFNTRLEDNTRALIRYMLKKGYGKKYKLVCCMPRNKNYDEFRKYGVKTVGAFGSIIYYMTSKYFFTSFGNTRITPSKSQRVINQWHGTPLKAIGSFGGDHAEEKLDYFTYTLASSDFFKPIMAKAFGCSEEKIMVMGHTRNDQLFFKKEKLSGFGFGSDYSKKILWMPTFRKSNDNKYSDGVSTQTSLPVLSTFDEYNQFNEFLKKKNVLLVIKVHNYSTGLTISNLSNIKIISNSDLAEKNTELYDLIKDFDALVTDYSSVYFDYLLTDKPIGFTVDDYETYMENRGFIFENALDYMPGMHIYNYDELEAFIGNVVDGNDDYAEQRKKINDLSNKYQDGNVSRRLLESVGIRL